MSQSGRLVVAVGDDMVHIAEVIGDGSLGQPDAWPIAQFRTLTDVLLAFERARDFPLLNARCAIGVLGATNGESILLSRGQWAISRSGLRSMFRRDVIIINDVAARAWALLGRPLGRLTGFSVGAPASPEFRRCGRWTVTNIARGVGLAVIDVDQTGAPRVLECEMGHCGFAPATAEEIALAAAYARRAMKPATWEAILTLPVTDPLWETLAVPRDKRMPLLAAAAGRYIGETVLAHGAWAGAIITGARIGEIATEECKRAFNAAFENKPKFQRLVHSTPRWRLTGDELTLAGLAVAIDRHPANGAVLIAA